MATDSFTASNGTELTGYSANWTIGNGISSDFVIESNALRTPFNRPVLLHAFYNAGSFANDQYAEAKITQIGSADQAMGVCVRAAAGECYGIFVDGLDYYLYRLQAYGSYSFLSQGLLTVVAGDILRLEALGTQLTAKLNGSTIATATDANIAGGKPGVCGGSGAASGTYTLLDDWVGDDLSTAAPQFYQYDWPHQLHARR